MSLSCRFELFGLVDLLVDSDFCKFAIPAKYCSWNTDSWNFFATGWYFTHASHWLPSDVTIPHSLCRTLRQKNYKATYIFWLFLSNLWTYCSSKSIFQGQSFIIIIVKNSWPTLWDNSANRVETGDARTKFERSDRRKKQFRTLRCNFHRKATFINHNF